MNDTTKGQGHSRLSGALQGRQPGGEKTLFTEFRRQINLLRPDMAKMIGADKVDKFIRVCLNAVQANPAALEADRRSLFQAAMAAAQDGLMPDGNEAVFNVYNTKVKEGNTERWVATVQYLPMAFGLVQKIYESGATYVDAAAVYEKEMPEFEYRRGDDPLIKHIPWRGGDDRGNVAAAYVVVKYKNLETKREVMFRADIEKVRKKSRAPNGLMWKEGEDGFYDQGAIKSVIHRIVKQLPEAERLRAALMNDNRAIGLADVPVVAEADAGIDLVALVDGRLETELKDAPLGGTGKTHEGEVLAKTVENGDKTTSEIVGGTNTGTGAAGIAHDAHVPQPGDAGTPALKQKLLDRMAAAKAGDVLDIVIDEVRFFKWENADKADLDAAAVKRKAEIAAEPDPKRKK